EQGLVVAEALKLRNARKHRHGGVGFRAGAFSHGDDSPAPNGNTEQGMVLHDGADAADGLILGGIPKRFAPQTGLAGELVNKHMEEYVESELARRKRNAVEALEQQSSHQDGTSQSARGFDSVATVGGKQVETQRALLGKLQEIDLGDEARARNIAMTERARRRLQGLAAEDEEVPGSPPKKARLGPDGKPWRPRNRRGSDDIKRDQLVEEFLSENRLDVYDMAPETTAPETGMDEEELAADDRIAEQFRRDFMDAMSQRHRRRKPAINAVPRPKANQDEILKGPKLGGSRNARAAMRDLLLKEQVRKQR
ncbi:hepatocellular carcinoma-associated antigen 59-domain-containing protein, partial [Lasiosphaeria miniovina]